MSVDVGDVGHIVTRGFHPIRQRKLPKKPFPGTRRKRCVQDLAVFAIWPIETNLDIRTTPPLFLPIIVERKMVRPTVVSLPSYIRALKNDIGGAAITHNEDDVALHSACPSGQFAEVNPAQPI